MNNNPETDMKKTSAFHIVLVCCAIMFMLNILTLSEVVVNNEAKVCQNVGQAQVCKTLIHQETYTHNIFRKAIDVLKSKPEPQPRPQLHSTPAVPEKTLGEILMSRCGGHKVNCQSI